MKIEIFKDKNGVISSFRHGRANNAVNKPIKENVYNIKDMDIKELLIALDHTAIVGTTKDHDFNSGDLYLKVIDNQNYNIYKGEFLKNIYQ